MHLYEMTAAMQKLADKLEAANEAEDENAAEAWQAALEELDEDVDEKLLGIGKLIEHYRAQATAIKEVAARQSKRAKAVEGKAAWLEQYALSAMKSTGHTKIIDPELTLKIKTGNGAVEVTDLEQLPVEFIRVKKIKEADKSSIRDLLLGKKDKGEEPAIPGARLVFSEKLEIK